MLGKSWKMGLDGWTARHFTVILYQAYGEISVEIFSLSSSRQNHVHSTMAKDTVFYAKSGIHVHFLHPLILLWYEATINHVFLFVFSWGALFESKRATFCWHVWKCITTHPGMQFSGHEQHCCILYYQYRRSVMMIRPGKDLKACWLSSSSTRCWCCFSLVSQCITILKINYD